MGLLSRLDAIPDRSVNTDYRDDKTVKTIKTALRTDAASAQMFEKRPLIQKDDQAVIQAIEKIGRLQQIKRFSLDHMGKELFGIQKFNPNSTIKLNEL